MQLLTNYALTLLPSVVRRAAKTGSEDAIVPRVSAEVDNAHALLLDVNVTQMSVEIAGLGNVSNILAVNLILCLLCFLNLHVSVLILHLIEKFISLSQ